MNDVIKSRVQIEDSVLKSLMPEVKETLAADIVMPRLPEARSFSVVDLWNIRRNAKKSTAMLREKMKG